MKLLDVHFCGWGERFPLGRLADAGGKLFFEYSAEALSRGIEHSPLQLPLRPGALGGFPLWQQQLPGFIADALPDGWGLLLMDRLCQRRGRDPRSLSALDRLAFVGERAMGALAFEPADDAAHDAQDLSLLQLANETQKIVSGADSEALALLAQLGGSPHGARPKVLVQMDGTSCSSDAAAAGEPWLVKFPGGGEHAEVCAIEQVYADVARACGIAMPPSRHFILSKSMAAFGVRRFDREQGQRVPLLSMAGALHADFRLPTLDYRSLLRATQALTGDVRDVRKAFLRCVFNVGLHNRDDHAKNFALRMNADWRWQLSPAFDLTFSYGPGGQHHTAVMGEGAAPGRRELLALAADAGLPEAFARECIERVCAAAGGLAPRLRDAGVRARTAADVGKTVDACLARCWRG